MFAATSRSEAGPVVALLQRARGEGRVGFAATPQGTMLRTLFQDGAAKIRLPRTHDADGEAILINSAGGLTGGDRLAFAVEVGAHATATVTTQACERVYRSIDGAAEVAVELKAGPAARLDWLPQETILFDRACFSRRIDVDLGEKAEFLAVEAVIFGRRAMGESVAEGLFRDRWRLRREGRLIHADDIVLRGAISLLAARTAVLAGAGAMATIIGVTNEPDRLLDAVRVALGEWGGASAFGGKLVARVVAHDGRELRRRLVPAIIALRGGRPLPKAWQF